MASSTMAPVAKLMVLLLVAVYVSSQPITNAPLEPSKLTDVASQLDGQKNSVSGVSPAGSSSQLQTSALLNSAAPMGAAGSLQKNTLMGALSAGASSQPFTNALSDSSKLGGINPSGSEKKSVSAAASKVCSGFGKLGTGNICECKTGYVGEDCSLRVLNPKHGHGRFVGSADCQHGTIVQNKCVCDSGWAGFHCSRVVCVNGKYGCPKGKPFCGDGSDPRLPKPICNCNPGYFGPSCTSTTPPVVTPPKPKKPAAPAKPVCAAVKKCINTGIFDSATCGCKCTSPWTGDFCEKCESRQCMNGMVQDPNSCGCVCPPTRQCKHNGILDTDTCGCNCTGAWTGNECDKCNVPPPGTDICNGHGAFSADDCGCVCMPPWLPESNCKTCSLSADKCLHGTYSAHNCSCTCEGSWTGELCDECPSEEELLVQGIDCDGREFNRKTCTCDKQCKALNCANGGKQNPNTCRCECNLPEGAQAGGANGPAPGTAANAYPNSSAFLEMLVDTSGPQTNNKTFWSGTECTVCKQPQPSPCGARGFNMSGCACDEGCPRLDCSHGGVFNGDSCACDCPAGWAGIQCAQRADGRSPLLAAKSCKVLQMTNPNATSGVYWINPSGQDSAKKAFQAECDMTGDGGGWTRLAAIGQQLRSVKLLAADYKDGKGNGPPNREYIHKCSMFNNMASAKPGAGALKSVMVRVKMGAVIDFFKPVEGATLCEMLQSRNKHMWSPTRGKGADELKEEESNTASSESEADAAAKAGLEAGEEMMNFAELASTQPEEKGLFRRLLSFASGRSASRSLRMTSTAEELTKALEGATQGTEEGADQGTTELVEADKDESGWFTPDYEDLPGLANVLGGCKKKWPQDIDDRMYISFWGGNKGGCCHRSSKLFPGAQGGVDTGSWSQEFTLDVIEVPTSADMTGGKTEAQLEKSKKMMFLEEAENAEEEECHNCDRVNVTDNSDDPDVTDTTRFDITRD